MNIGHSIYYRLPSSLKKVINSLPSYIPMNIYYGKEYRKWKKFLYESENWNEEKRRDYEVRQLKKTLQCAYDNTLYYKQLFDECGFDVRSFCRVEQLNQIPYVTKEIVQERREDMMNRNISSSQIVYTTTGGSTGIPMGLYRQKCDRIREAAFIDFIWERVGYQHTSKIGVIRGAYLGEQGPAYRQGNRLYLSAYHMSEQDLKIQYDALAEFRPRYLHVYPSAITVLCEYIKKHNLKPINSIQAVLTASENLYTYQKEIIENCLKCPVYDFYGHTEHACLAASCMDRDKYYFLWQYGYVEFVNRSFDEEMETSEIVATTYDNYVMPLIRYKTMDLVKESSDLFHNQYQVVDSIEGRLQEMLITSKGRRISMTAMNMHNNIFDNVKQFQFHQDNVYFCTLNIVKNKAYSSVDEIKIRNEVSKKLGEDIELRIRYVDSIPRTKNGKYRFLIQELKIN